MNIYKKAIKLMVVKANESDEDDFPTIPTDEEIDQLEEAVDKPRETPTDEEMDIPIDEEMGVPTDEEIDILSDPPPPTSEGEASSEDDMDLLPSDEEMDDILKILSKVPVLGQPTVFEQASKLILEFDSAVKIKKAPDKTLLLIFALLDPEDKLSKKYLKILESTINEIKRRGLEPPEHITMDLAHKAAQQIIEYSENGQLEKGLSTKPSATLYEYPQKKKRETGFSKFRRKLIEKETRWEVLENKQSIETIKEFLTSTYHEAALNALNEWRIENGLPLEKMPESTLDEKAKYQQGETTYDKIKELIQTYIDTHNIETKDNKENPNIPIRFYALLNKINQDYSFTFAQEIYTLLIEMDQKNKGRIAERFVKWLKDRLKEVLLEINTTTDSKLSESNINWLITSSGTFINEIIKDCLIGENKNFFYDKIKTSIEEKIEESKKSKEWINIFLEELSPEERSVNMIQLIISLQNRFEQNSFEAKGIKSYYYAFANNKLTTNLTEKEKQNLLEEGATIDSHVPELGLKYYIDTEEQIITFVTRCKDIEAVNEINQALQNLETSTNIYKPQLQTPWEQKVIEIGKAKLGRMELSNKIKSEQSPITYRELFYLKKEYEQKYKNINIEYVSKFDEDGNEIELTADQQQQAALPNKIIEAAKEYLKDEDLYYLAASFKIVGKIHNVAVGDAVKLTDTESMNRLIRYGVREPGILMPYRNTNGGRPI